MLAVGLVTVPHLQWYTSSQIMFSPEIPLSSNGSLLAGTIMLGVAAYFIFMLCLRWARLRRMMRMRHGDGEKGPPVSRFTGLTIAILTAGFGFVAIADGYFHAITSQKAVRILLLLFSLMFLGCIYDQVRARKHRSRKRPSP